MPITFGSAAAAEKFWPRGGALQVKIGVTPPIHATADPFMIIRLGVWCKQLRRILLFGKRASPVSHRVLLLKLEAAGASTSNAKLGNHYDYAMPR